MKLTKNIVDLTDRFLREEMTQDELNDFLNQLKENESTKNQVDQLKIIQKGITYSGLSELLDKTEKWEEEIIRNNSVAIGERQNYKSKAPLYLWSGICSIAASFVLVAFIFVQQKKDHLQHIERHFKHQYSEFTATRSESSPQMSPLKERAYSHYKTREYKLAARDLEKVFKDEGDWKSLLYAAIANLGHGKIEKAEEQINQYLNTHPNDDIAQMYLSLIARIKKDMEIDT